VSQYAPTPNDPMTTGRPAGDDRGGIGLAWVLVGILAVIIILLVAWWLWQGGATPAQTLRGASLGAIIEQPAEHEGDRVVVSGRVERLLTENAMTLGSDLVEGELLVVTPPGAFVNGAGGAAGAGGGGLGGVAAPAGGGAGTGLFLEGQFVQITGTVRQFDSAQMTEEWGLVLAPELFEQFEGGPVLVTEFFDIAVLGVGAGAPIELEDVDVGAVLADPAMYAGQTARVAGSLGEVISDRAFTLTAPQAEGALLVVGDDTGRFDEAQPGTLVRVEGTILAFEEAALREEAVDLGEGVDYSAWEGEPAIVAMQVEVDEGEPVTTPADQTPAPADQTPAPADQTPPADETPAPADETATDATPAPADGTAPGIPGPPPPIPAPQAS
jgi:hypothetical protein